MSHLLAQCHTFDFSEPYAYADKVRKAIFESEYVIDPVDADSELDAQILKPQKWKILHDQIDYVVRDDLNFYFRGGGWDYEDVTPVFAILNSHQIEYLRLERISRSDTETMIQSRQFKLPMNTN